jgi:small-conductance mechanosensitive channel
MFFAVLQSTLLKETIMLKNKTLRFGALVTLIGAASSANAAVPTEATDALTAIGTDAAALATAAWPILAAIVSSFILMKLFKRFMGKAS